MFAAEEIEKALKEAGPHFRKTPLLRSRSLERMIGAKNPIYIKAENLQFTGSFKLRGALTKLLSILPEAKKRGVVAASAGNHAQGVAFHSQHLGINAKIVMPVGTPMVKRKATEALGAEVVLHGSVYDEAYSYAKELEEKDGRVYVHAFNDPEIIKGQATIAVEVFEALPEIKTFVCPIGGGGLMAGCSSYLKAKNPKIQFIGVQAQGCSSFLPSLEAGEPIELERVDTMAEGMAVKKMGDQTFPICRDNVSDTVLVDEEEIAEGILLALERERLFVEGCGGAVIAAAFQRPDLLQGPSVLLLSGGNLDVNLLNRIIERGMVRSGRRIKWDFKIADLPGHLEKLLRVLAEYHANILHIHHERAFGDSSVKEVYTTVEIETEGSEHIARIQKGLREAGFTAL